MRDKELNTYLDVGEDPAYAPTRREKADAQRRRLARLCAEAELRRAACRHVPEPVPHDPTASRCTICGKVTEDAITDRTLAQGDA